MLRENLNDLVAFMIVAREGSFTKAASQLRVSQSALSHAIRGLEERLGIRLLARSTRSVSPSEAGEALLKTLAPRLEEIESALVSLGDLQGKPTGTVRINCSKHAVTHVWSKLTPFLKDYPDIQVEISADNSFADIVAERFDFGVRLGETVPKDMIAIPLTASMRLAAVATPAYFDQYGVPNHPQQLETHNCINVRLPTYGGFYAWEFAKNGQELAVRVSGQLAFNDSQHILAAVLDGYGICYVPEDMVSEHIQTWRLQRVLEDWTPTFDGYYLYYPNRRNHSTAFSLVLEALRYKK